VRRQALSKVFAAFAGGFGAGFVLDAVVIGLGQVSEALREQERQAQALRQIHRDTWRTAIDSLDEYQQGLSTTDRRRRQGLARDLEARHRRGRKIQDEIDDYESSLSAKFRDFGEGGILNFSSAVRRSRPDRRHRHRRPRRSTSSSQKQQAAKDALKDPTSKKPSGSRRRPRTRRSTPSFFASRNGSRAETDDEIAKIRGRPEQARNAAPSRTSRTDEDYSARRVTLDRGGGREDPPHPRGPRAPGECRRRTLEAQNGTEIEKLDADHENRLEELRERIRRTSIAAEQQRIRQEIADETAGYVAKRELLERERDARLLARPDDVDRKRYEQSLGFLKTQADLEDVAGLATRPAATSSLRRTSCASSRRTTASGPTWRSCTARKGLRGSSTSAPSSTSTSGPRPSGWRVRRGVRRASSSIRSFRTGSGPRADALRDL
jgi:hypothetical protein